MSIPFSVGSYRLFQREGGLDGSLSETEWSCRIYLLHRWMSLRSSKEIIGRGFVEWLEGIKNGGDESFNNCD